MQQDRILRERFCRGLGCPQQAQRGTVRDRSGDSNIRKEYRYPLLAAVILKSACDKLARKNISFANRYSYMNDVETCWYMYHFCIHY